MFYVVGTGKVVDYSSENELKNLNIRLMLMKKWRRMRNKNKLFLEFIVY